MQTSREQALTTLTSKGMMANKRKPIDPNRPLTDAERVYYTLATTEMIPYRPEDHDQVRGGLNAAINTTAPFGPIAAHRTRKAFAKMIEILVEKGMLSPDELDEILLTAVDFQELKASGGAPRVL